MKIERVLVAGLLAAGVAQALDLRRATVSADAESAAQSAA